MEKLFREKYPLIDEFVREQGWIQIGSDGFLGGFVQAADEGGIVWEGKRHYDSVEDALADLERGLAKWKEIEAIEVYEGDGVLPHMQPTYDEIVRLIDAVCLKHLDQEYADLSRKLAFEACRLIPCPLQHGRPKTWAAAIVYVLGQINFLFDKSQKPHMRATDLCKAFDVSQQSVSPKARELGDLFDLSPMTHKWLRQGMIEDNPAVWIVMINGFLTDIRSEPREIQVIAFEQGIIPYIPADKRA
jgi:hypothetical protein